MIHCVEKVFQGLDAGHCARQLRFSSSPSRLALKKGTCASRDCLHSHVFIATLQRSATDVYFQVWHRLSFFFGWNVRRMDLSPCMVGMLMLLILRRCGDATMVCRQVRFSFLPLFSYLGGRSNGFFFFSFGFRLPFSLPLVPTSGNASVVRSVVHSYRGCPTVMGHFSPRTDQSRKRAGIFPFGWFGFE